ncbi:MAG: aminotransferase class V-fold PLP-dependent enzyme [Candidatus Eisenbacteria bacterium]|nr:aminotransferase class V-fold PLP-dependent enzyme [Candidatus Eisenbacteria bacterium]
MASVQDVDQQLGCSEEGQAPEFFVPEVLGADHRVPLLSGAWVRQIFLDNAASTKPFRAVSTFLRDMEGYYSNIHRGTGFDSNFCTQRYEEAREIVKRFVGGDPERDIVIPVRNSTEGLNLLATSFDLQPEQIVLTTLLEHHSNDLPWRGKAAVRYVHLRPEDARLDLADLEAQLQAAQGRVRLVAVTGASNITGEVLPVHRVAELAHRHGAQVVIDAAQLAPHRSIDMRPHEDPGHLDFVVFSAHKMNSPYGEGAIVGRRDHFAEAVPYLQGGGTVYSVSLDHVVWADPPDRQEAGTPNVLGLFALGAAIRIYERIGLDRVAAHEAELTRCLLRGMHQIPGLAIFGRSDPEELDDRLGVVTFIVEDVPHQLAAAVLSYEHGIAVRSGCFCAHPLIKHLLGVSREEESSLEQKIRQGDRRFIPGAVRASIGLHNTAEDVERLLVALREIAARRWQGDYAQDVETGEFHPRGFRFDFRNCPAFPDGRPARR